MFSYLYLSVCLRVTACAVLRIGSATQQPLCSSEHMVSDTSLSSAILSIQLMAAKTAVLFTVTEGLFEGKYGRALVEVYSPAYHFGLHG